ncbi:MAG: hypothetical protein MUP13_12570 [Thermoanaerobaculales bacterium]|nr:hypothetical protein [Thermoanaerobaculales bacterium]
MTQWRIKYRGRDDLTEETITADEFIDNGEWVDFVLDPADGDQEKLLRVRASDVIEVRFVANPDA